MKIINILGGLGNQMFQYAMAVAIKDAFPKEVVKINIQCFNGYPLHNGYELNHIFPIALPYASTKDLIKYAYPWIHYRLWQLGRHLFPTRQCMVWDKNFPNDFSMSDVVDKVYFDGYWQSPKFFCGHRDAILSSFQFPEMTDKLNSNVLRYINKNRVAFIHVRRGDYVNHPIFGGIATQKYYENGISLLREKYDYSDFLIFSNDVNWCKENLLNLLDGCNVIFVDWNIGKNSYKDMQLMSLCSAGIIANSSFSWWGAWLSDSKTIICPNRWTNIPGHHDDIIPSDWIRVSIH